MPHSSFVTARLPRRRNVYAKITFARRVAKAAAPSACQLRLRLGRPPITPVNSTTWFGAPLKLPRPTSKQPPVGGEGRRRRHGSTGAGAAPPQRRLRFKDRFSAMSNEHPRPPPCPSCSEIMRLARTTSRLSDLPDLHYTFECRPCGVLYTEAEAERRCEMGADCNYNSSATTMANGPDGITAEVLCSPSLYSTISALSPFHH